MFVSRVYTWATRTLLVISLLPCSPQKSSIAQENSYEKFVYLNMLNDVKEEFFITLQKNIYKRDSQICVQK
jgi:hypothetical protein